MGHLMSTAEGLPQSVDATLQLLNSRGYFAERSLATVVYLSLRLGRPLFLEGEAGGKGYLPDFLD